VTEFMNKSFSVGMAGDQQYRDNWERIFGKKEEKPEPPKEPELLCGCGRPGQLCNDPYVEEIHGRVEEVVLCDSCYQESCDDI
jgi:hypothetical protein